MSWPPRIATAISKASGLLLLCSVRLSPRFSAVYTSPLLLVFSTDQKKVIGYGSGGELHMITVRVCPLFTVGRWGLLVKGWHLRPGQAVCLYSAFLLSSKLCSIHHTDHTASLLHLVHSRGPGRQPHRNKLPRHHQNKPYLATMHYLLSTAQSLVFKYFV